LGNQILVTETLDYKRTQKDIIGASAIIEMLGIFEQVGESILTPEQFGKVNGAAIIFSFISEHLAGLCNKSGIGFVLLSPINFTNN